MVRLLAEGFTFHVVLANMEDDTVALQRKASTI